MDNEPGQVEGQPLRRPPVVAATGTISAPGRVTERQDIVPEVTALGVAQPVTLEPIPVTGRATVQAIATKLVGHQA